MGLNIFKNIGEWALQKKKKWMRFSLTTITKTSRWMGFTPGGGGGGRGEGGDVGGGWCKGQTRVTPDSQPADHYQNPIIGKNSPALKRTPQPPTPPSLSQPALVPRHAGLGQLRYYWP